MRLTEPDVEIVNIDLPDDDLTCNWWSCDASAVWWHECVCGRPAYRCDRHRVIGDAYCSRTPTGYVLCKRCRAHVPVPIDWQPLR